MNTVPPPLPPRQLPLARLGHLVPPLVNVAALVALVTLTDDRPWAAKAAWDIARIAARDGRRVALVDLCLEHPALHEVVGLSTTEGIVDAFEYGVSLNKAAHEVTGVFIIPAGSDTAHPAEVYGHARWPKLQAGFRSEGALLILLLPLAGLAQLSATPDGVFALAPEGLAPSFALPRDVPLLGVVRDRWLPSNPRLSPPAMPVPIAEQPRRGLRVAVGALVVAGLAVGGWALLAAEGVGDLVLAPYSYHAPAGASLEQLRRRGLPAMRWSNGVILLGAFVGPDQAAYTQAALKRAGVRANLLPRMGTP